VITAPVSQCAGASNSNSGNILLFYIHVPHLNLFKDSRYFKKAEKAFVIHNLLPGRLRLTVPIQVLELTIIKTCSERQTFVTDGN
jgi:hypothetical protein